MDDAATARGRHPGLADVIIAATAAVHGLTVLSANGKHFEALDVPSVDPFA
jgi:predicted nucleic acid-binding protein